MQTAEISEIFQSIQGEGKYAGVRQVFVRFFGCHMHCDWCDTPDSIGDTTRDFKEMKLTDVFAKIQELWKDCHSVSLTGGEPLLQVEFIQGLLPLLKKGDLPVYLETSGVLHQSLGAIIKDVDIIAMDIKMPSSTKERPYWEEHAAFLAEACRWERDVFVKAVVTSDTEMPDILKAAKLIEKIDPKIWLILQPNTFQLDNGVMSKCVDFQRLCLTYLPNTRVMPQMHKFMKIQ